MLQLTAADPVVPNVYSGTFHVLRLSPGIVATDPVIWGMLQHLIPCFKTFTALKLHVCGSSEPDENQADR